MHKQCNEPWQTIRESRNIPIPHGQAFILKYDQFTKMQCNS